ncbi:NUDIX domain-containing protein [Priestia megaterium]|nr:NUDIX domain-containing protein [Priestia megaterium]
MMESAPVFGYKEKGKAYRKSAGVYGVIWNEETSEIRLVKNDKGDYFLPGGGLEDHETPEDCLRRECVEELNVQVCIQTFVGCAKQYFQSPVDQQHYLNEAHFYLCKEKQASGVKEKRYPSLWMKPSLAIKLLEHEHHSWAVVKCMSGALTKLNTSVAADKGDRA